MGCDMKEDHGTYTVVTMIHFTPQVDLLPSDGRQEDGNARQGGLSAKRLKEVGSLQDVLAMWEERLPGAQVLPISALERINTHKVGEIKNVLV